MSMKRRTTMAEVLRDAVAGEANQDKDCYLPSPEKIREECEKIQAGWGSHVRTKQRGGVSKEYEIPVVADWRV